MPRYVHKDTGHTVETSNATEGVLLRASGYREQRARTQAVKAADEAKASDKPATK